MLSPLPPPSGLSCPLTHAPAIGEIFLERRKVETAFPVLWAGWFSDETRICLLNVRLPREARSCLRPGRIVRVRLFPGGQGQPAFVWQCRYLRRSSFGTLVTMRCEFLEGRR